MKIKLITTVLLAMFAAMPSQAAPIELPPLGPPDTVPAPISFIRIGNRILPSPAVERNGDLFNSIFNAEGEGWSLSGEMTGDADPWISYSLNLTTTEGSGPISVSFNFAIPIVETGSPNEVFASLGVTAVDATGDGVTITPTGGTIQTSFVDDDGSGLTNMGVDVGGLLSVSGLGAHVFGPIQAGTQIGPVHTVDGWDFLSVDVAFMLSGNGDTVGMTGFASIIENGSGIPTPSALTIGLVLLATAGSRRPRKA